MLYQAQDLDISHVFDSGSGFTSMLAEVFQINERKHADAACDKI